MPVFKAKLVFMKHPHGRGEDAVRIILNAPPEETPPRAWGRPWFALVPMQSWRNTPTGVGKTGRHDAGSGGISKHPHGRGEDNCVEGWYTRDRETPPRAWGRPEQGKVSTVSGRNTPTGVGKTRGRSTSPPEGKKHPHGRGEDSIVEQLAPHEPETPPRAWGRQQRRQQAP